MERFDTQPNALNILRLGLATVVVVWHAHLLPTRGPLPRPLQQLIEEVPVDAFFAISGFLIVRSWHQRPHLGRYLTARASRLLPGLWGCLVVTAFVIVPVTAMMTGAQVPSLTAQLHYVAANAGVWIGSPEIAGVSHGGAWTTWNISLWSLWWEALAYLAVAVLGILGRLRVGAFVAIAASLWSVGFALTLNGWWLMLSKQSWLHAFPRLGLMFCVGGLLWMLRDRIPVSRGLAAASVALLMVALWTPNYRLIAAGSLAYLTLYLSLYLGRWSKLRLRNDVSYGVYVYGAPVQQALIMAGFVGSWLTFSVATFLVVLPLAGLSWGLIERPAMRWARRRANAAGKVANPAMARLQQGT
jgi:peptidoglycan/LPS O-acetylase OafA/YrhL